MIAGAGLISVPAWFSDAWYVECIVMMSAGWVTLDCQNISGCHADYDKPIMGFTFLSHKFLQCGLMAWLVWLTDDTSLRRMAQLVWCLFCYVGKACLVVNYHRCCSAGWFIEQYVSIWCVCVYMYGLFLLASMLTTWLNLMVAHGLDPRGCMASALQIWSAGHVLVRFWALVPCIWFVESLNAKCGMGDMLFSPRPYEEGIIWWCS